MYPEETAQMKSSPCMKLFTAAQVSMKKKKGQVKTEQQFNTSQLPEFFEKRNICPLDKSAI
jgi:hypothetical protein